MIEILFFAGVVLAAGSGGIGWVAGRRRGSREAEAVADGRLAALGNKRDGAEKRARDAQQESARWKNTSLAGESLTTAAVFDERPAPRDAEALATLARGLAFVDDVVIADKSGNPLTRENHEASADLAALAGHVFSLCRTMALDGFPVRDVAIETVDATRVNVRPLGGRADGLAMLVRTTSQPVNPLVVDAVFHAALRPGDELPSVLVPLAFHGTSDSHVEEGVFSAMAEVIERQVKGDRDLTALTLADDDRIVMSVAANGPARVVRERTAAAVRAFAAVAGRVLRVDGVARIDVALRGGFTMTWAAVGPRSRLSVVAFGPTASRSSARLERILGSLRRQNDFGSLPTPQRDRP